jgi:dCTP diphosphatase
MPPKKTNVIQELTNVAITFRDERDWKKFHNPKDLAISLALEASEVLEHFQWKTPHQVKQHVQKKKEEIGDELADVLFHLLTISHDLDINLISAFKLKMKKNAEKYPVEKVKGKNKKYTEY